MRRAFDMIAVSIATLPYTHTHTHSHTRRQLVGHAHRTHPLEMTNDALRETDDSQKYPKYPIERPHFVCDTICDGTPR